MAQELLYNKYKKILSSYLKKNYSSNYIEDDVSEILIKVFLGLDKFDGTKSKFSSWVISIAKNHMIDKWRSNSVTITGSNTTCAFTGDMTSSTAYYTSTTNDFGDFTTTNLTDYDFENCSSINLISCQLTPQDYTLLDMKYMQGYNYDEIGSEFNLTSTTISNRVNYIKTKLKKNNPEIIF